MLALLSLVAVSPGLAPQTAPKPAYTQMKLEGFRLFVESTLIRTRAQTWAEVRTELHRQLLGIRRVLPKPALEKVRQVHIFIHATSPETRCMAYHPSATWLREHRMNPDMEGDIEIGHADNFISWTRQQPWMVLHELAHAYHARFLPNGFENAELKAAHQRAIESKKYDAVMHWNGSTSPHYAKNDPMEFFAEATEAYFGQNDFYPFVHAELRAHDPETFRLIETLWNRP